MYSLLCVFVSQYSSKVDFISIAEAQMGVQGGSSPKLPPIGAVTSQMVKWKVMSGLRPY